MTSRSVARLAVAASIALLVACTTEQQSSPQPTLTSTTSTTTTSTTTTVPPPESTTTTTAPPESTTTVPSGPADALVPLLIGGSSDGGWLFLGAWQQDRWQVATDPAGNPIRPGIEAGTPFVVSNLAGETPVTLGENTEACFDGRVGPAIDLDIAPPDPPGFGYSAVAVLQKPWQLKPRPIAVSSTAPEAYRALGEAAFEDEDVDATRGAVEQLVVTDLDGDGDDEALVSFEFVQPSAGPGAPGDLAALLIVDATTRAADTVLLSAVPADTGDDGPFEITERYRILDVADLNGDGRMEVLVHAWYYEGAAVIVYTYGDDGALTEVLSAGSGA
ncbi:MAG: hypothetical protein ACM3MM_04000 [Acidobacteriota bacterium]